MENKYKVKVYCTNCDFQGETEIPKEILVTDHLCPKCGNVSLKKMQEVRYFPKKKERYI